MTFIPFRADMAQAIREGRKTMTTRTKRYGHPGDVLDSPAGLIRLERVERVPLEQVATMYYHQEGLKSAAEFRLGWAELHPRNGFDPDQMVYLHEFSIGATA